MSESAIQALGLRKTYRSGRIDTEVLRGLDLTVQRGSFVAVMGPSGCGKSTLLHVIGLMMRPDAGALVLDGQAVEDLSDRRRTELRRTGVGFVFQRFNLLASISALGNVRLAARLRGADTRGEPGEMLARVGLDGQIHRRPGQLSIGEQQRVAIARALVGRPALLLADEPTGNLDSDNSQRILQLIRELHEQFGQTTVMITHSSTAADFADVVHRMKDGRIQAAD